MRKYLFFIVTMVAVALVSCNNREKEVYPEFEPFIFEATDGSTYEVMITYQRIANMWDREVFVKIEWQNYTNSFAGYDTEVVSNDDGFIRMDLDAMAKHIVDEYSGYAEESEGPMCCYSMDQSAFFVRNNSVLCYETIVESYTGGAHGGQTLWYECFDLNTGSLYDFSYLFEGEWSDDLRSLVYDKLVAEYTIWIDAPELLPIAGSVMLSDEGVVLVYQPYEVASYSEGIISVEITDEELEQMAVPLLWE
jgi:hypothetical protein